MSHSSSITNPNVFLEMTRPTQPLIGLPADSKKSWDSQLTANSCANASPPPPKKKKEIKVYSITCIHHYGFILHSLKKRHCSSRLD